MDYPAPEKLLFNRFVQRSDAYMLHTTSNGYFLVAEPVTPELVNRHIKGIITLGVFSTNADLVRWLCLDLDGLHGSADNAREAVLNLAATCRKFGLSPLIERSGGKGWHLWLFCEELPARLARRIGYGLLQEAGDESLIGAVLPVEVFPKQDVPGGKGFGNQVKLPWGKRRDNGARLWFVGSDLEPLGADDQYPALFSAQVSTEAEWLELVEENGWQDIAPPAPPVTEGRTEESDFQPASLQPILTGCGWFRSCFERADKLAEPEWYAWLSITGNVENGRELVHDWSARDIRYDRKETEAKLDHALKASGPRTCANLQSMFQPAECAGCIHNGRIKSPIALARGRWAEEVPPPEETSFPVEMVDYALVSLDRDDLPEAQEMDARLQTLVQDLDDDLDGKEPGKKGKDSKNPSDLVLARRWARDMQERFAFFEGSQWYEYAVGRWTYSNTEMAEAEVQRLMERLRNNGVDVLVNAARVSGVLKLSRAHLGVHRISEFNARPTLIPLRNGVYDAETAELLPHSPKWMLTNQLPVDFQPGAECPLWKNFLAEVLIDQVGKPCQEWIDAIQEWFGYCLVPDNSAQVSMVWVGEGRNGKGVATRALESLIGRDQSCAVPVEQLHDPYHRAELQGKLVGFVNEPDPRAMVKNGAWFKAIVGGDTISARRPTEKVFNFTPSCRLTISTNAIPSTKDLSHGYFRRLLIIEWRKHVLEADTQLDAKLRAELPGILNWALEGLKRFRDRGSRFNEMDESTKLLTAYKLGEDPLRQFITEECETDAKVWLWTNEFFKSFRLWATANGYREVGSQHAFTKRLKQMGFTADHGTREKKNGRYILGAWIKADSEYHPDNLSKADEQRRLF